MLTYEDARATVMAADQDAFTLPEYDGGPTDLNYLKNWVLGQVETIYNVSASVFDTATIYSTSILRDFVHRALYQEMGRPYIDNVQLEYAWNSDVATAFRYPAWGLCGLIAWQEYQVFRSFGYDTHEIDIINGDVGLLNSLPDVYTNSHVTTEVYLTDYDKTIVQDATFNFLFEDEGVPLSFQEARYDLYAGDGTLDFDSFNYYYDYRNGGQVLDAPPESIKDEFYTQYLKLPITDWGNEGTKDADVFAMFPDWTTAHNPGSNQGMTFATFYDGGALVYNLVSAGQDWLTIAQTLRSNGYYVSGFALVDNEKEVISHWITIRTASGLYLSIDIDHHTDLNGSYDELVNNATGGPDINPGKDLSDFLQPAYLLDYSGNVLDGFVDRTGQIYVDLPDHNTSEYYGAFDFNGDSKSDLFFANDTNHGLAIWQMDGTTVVAGPQIGTMSSGFHFEMTGDFNGDGKTDLLLLNDSTHQLSMWEMNGTTILANSTIGTINAVGGWQFETTGDFNGDGKTDLLFLNNTNHGVAIWQMDGTTVVANPQIGTINAAGGWQFETTGDFNGDGKTDLLFLNNTNHGVAIWQMDGTTVVANPQIGTINAAGGWQFETTGDFNGDGKTDLLFLNNTNHGVAIWQMDGTTVVANPQIGTINAAGGWQFETTGDFNGDGKTDLLFLNNTNQGVAIWQMDGTTVVANPQIGTMNSGFHFATVGDFNGDGKTDLLFENDGTHQLSVWEINGTQIVANSTIGTINAAADWHLVV